MSVAVVRYQTKPERADENQVLIEEVFGALETSEPDGLRYATFRLADGVSFVHVASIETDDGTNPLTATPAFTEFVRDISDRLEQGPFASDATTVGSYRFWPAGTANETEDRR
jgi:hypothetical protein